MAQVGRRHDNELLLVNRATCLAHNEADGQVVQLQELYGRPYRRPVVYKIPAFKQVMREKIEVYCPSKRTQILELYLVELPIQHSNDAWNQLSVLVTVPLDLIEILTLDKRAPLSGDVQYLLQRCL